MSQFDIKDLLKQGKITEAYNEAIDAVKLSNNSWTRMRMFWVLREMCEQWSIPLQQADYTRSILKQMAWLLSTPIENKDFLQREYREIEMQLLPLGVEMMRYYRWSKKDANAAYQQLIEDKSIRANELHWALQELYGWVLLNYLKRSQTREDLHAQKQILFHYLQLQNRRPSPLHSQVLNFALRLYKERNGFSLSQFVVLWNTRLLSKEDYEVFNTETASIPPLFVRTFHELGKECRVSHAYKLLYGVNEAHKREASEMLQKYAFPQLEQKLKTSLNEEERWNALLQYTQAYSIGGPSEYLSRVLTWTLYLLENSNQPDSYDFIAFMKAWNIKNFRPQDWLSSYPSPRPLPPLAERAIIQCIKQVAPPHKPSNNIWEWMIGLCNEALKQSTNQMRILRCLAKVFLWSDDKTNAHTIYTRIALLHPHIYYAWEGLSLCIDDKPLQLAFILKALSSTGLTLKATFRLQIRAALLLHAIHNNEVSLYFLQQIDLDSIDAQSELSNTYRHLLNLISPTTISRPLNNKEKEYYQWMTSHYIKDIGLEICNN